MSDDQTSAENLDDDKLTASYPPDVPLGLGDLVAQDVGAIGEVAEDDLAERVAREEPEEPPATVTEGPVTSWRGADDDSAEPVALLAEDPMSSDSSFPHEWGVSTDDDVVDIDNSGPEVFILSDEDTVPFEESVAAEDAAVHVEPD